jgi:hypothetical protein
MSVEDVARRHHEGRHRLTEAVGRLALQSWQHMDPASLDASWSALAPQLHAGVAGAQLAAARTADGYVGEALAEEGVDSASAAVVNPNALVGVASDGRPLDSLLFNSVTLVKAAIGSGVTIDRAMAAGFANLDMIVRTQVADAGRVADQVALVGHANVGYVRMLVGRSCSRCVVLAGRRYRWNAGFLRHPRCDCVHVPAAEDHADEIRTNPAAYFDSLSRTQQDKAFTKAGAQAIRDGADIGQVVNARRGAFGLAPAGARLSAEELRALRGGREVGRLETRNVFGRDLFITTEGTTTRGVAGRRLGARAPRLMPESIYQIAGNDREEAIRLLRRNGYLLERPATARTGLPPIARPVRAARVPAAPKAAVTPKPVAPDARAVLERSIASGIRETEKLSGGAIGDVHLVTFNDGSQAVRKVAREPIFGYSNVRLTENEVLAEKVGRALRAPIPAVVRTGETEIFMEYVPDAKPGIWLFRGMGRAEQIPAISGFVRESGDPGHRLGLLDLLIANDDRHDANWLVRPDGSIVGIDHGLAWPISRITPTAIEHEEPRFKSGFAKLFNGGFAHLPNQGYIPNDLTPADIDWVEQRLVALRPDFDELGRGNYLDYSLARLRQLRPWARGTVNRIRP